MPQIQMVIPYLNVSDGWKAIDFYKRAFGAQVSNTIEREGGKLAHADVVVAGARFMMREEYSAYNFLSPTTLGGSTVNLFVYVNDVVCFTDRAVAEGATIIRPVQEQFHGDLMAELEDPFGHSWFFATHIADMTEDELTKRAREAGL
ncbi:MULTISPECIES: VOC family protein [Rhizobium]|uniref:VOC family protein n=1 Tax=Rhizobium TaxID=379 RepID=UPI001389E029|nr:MULTISPECIES: VOC family protein [Rhizobium]MBY5454387.1 VOC family protein [Rhizobium leguminosarum]NDK53535.1 VOC family protein [Rhizobium laguerreae]